MRRCGISLICGLILSAAPAVMGGTLAQFRSLTGDIEVELFDQEKPVTVANFLRYVRSNYYQNVFFHRCLPGFVVQGGGFAVATPGSTNLFTQVFGVPSLGTISNEFSTGPFLSNTNWTIAMAKSGGDPHSASSQWFFNLANNSTDLDNQSGGFTVFGRVVRGTNVLQQFNNRGAWNGLVNMGFWYPSNTFFATTFSTLPVYYAGVVYPRYVDLVYLDITLLSVQVALTAGGREISWNSVTDKTNQVEFTTNFPPVWQSLVATNGTGATMKVVDASVNNAARFYRVRVDY